MCLTELKPPGVPIYLSSRWFKRVPAWCVPHVNRDAKRGADPTAAIYQLANTRRHISLRVLLRLTAMDVCCGPPNSRTY